MKSPFIETRNEMALRIRRARTAWKLPSLLVSLLVFLSVCAGIFSHLESTNDKESYHKYHQRKLQYMDKYNMSEREFRDLMVDLTFINKRGFDGAYKNNWSFYHSFWFSITVITTMGFGHMVPVTFGGRLFCIVCALLGIPLNLLVLKNVGERISLIITNIIGRTECALRKIRRPKHQNVKCAVVSFSLMVAVILIGGGLDTIFDGWSFFDGVYFNFIAMSTIGFGDLFPRVDTATVLHRLGLGDGGTRIFASSIMLVYMIVGLSITSTVILSILKAIEEVSHIEVQWSRKEAAQSMVALRTLGGHKTPANKLGPEIIITPAVEDASESAKNAAFVGDDETDLTKVPV